MAGTVQWFPERLNAAIARGFQVSVPTVAADANATSPTRKAGAKVGTVSGNTATIVPTGLGPIVEGGASPHVIGPSEKNFLFLKGPGVFVSGPVSHPGSPANPYIHPAAARWARGGFHTSASATLRASGFGGVL